MPKTKKTLGRPRDGELDGRILDAALDELSQRGLAAMTMERVAAAAGVPKPTLYRRWNSKADLATAAIERLQATERLPTTRDTRARLRAILRNFRRNLLRPNGMSMIGTLLVEEQEHPRLLELFRERVVRPRREMLAQALRDGIEWGDIDPEVDVEVCVNLLVGSFYARHLEGRPIPRSWPDRILNALFGGKPG